MIPVDIDNFIVHAIANHCIEHHIYIGRFIEYLPKEIGNCTMLNKFLLNDTRVTDISPLSNCANLIDLDLYHNKIVDISPLSKCALLSYLDLSLNRIIDISVISNFTSLIILDLDNNIVVDTSPLSYCKSLKTVYAQKMKIVKKPVLNSKIVVYY